MQVSPGSGAGEEAKTDSSKELRVSVGRGKLALVERIDKPSTTRNIQKSTRLPGLIAKQRPLDKKPGSTCKSEPIQNPLAAKQKNPLRKKGPRPRFVVLGLVTCRPAIVATMWMCNSHLKPKSILLCSLFVWIDSGCFSCSETWKACLFLCFRNRNSEGQKIVCFRFASLT